MPGAEQPRRPEPESDEHHRELVGGERRPQQGDADRQGDAAVEARAANAPGQYELRWFRFDNVTNQRAPVGGAETVASASGRAPAELLTSGEFVGVSVTAKHEQHPGWANPVSFYFRASGQGSARGWELVGIERWRDSVTPALP